ncbi:MAG: hypothetical protein K2H51_01620 [Malacoplasma sp.]|nr:hypothetical protein [Malacoplasma sp.]
MKRIAIALLVVICGHIACMAQKGLAINRLFDGRYHKDSCAVETMVRGAAVQKYGLDLYRSVTITGRPSDANEMVSLIRSDVKNAVDSEESYKDGKLYYGFYSLGGKSANRYILYLNQHVAEGDKIVLLYLEGDAGVKQVKRMLKKKKSVMNVDNF